MKSTYSSSNEQLWKTGHFYFLSKINHFIVSTLNQITMNLRKSRSCN